MTGDRIDELIKFAPLDSTQVDTIRKKCARQLRFSLSYVEQSTLNAMVQSLTIEQMLELFPEEPCEFLDFNPLTGNDWEDE